MTMAFRRTAPALAALILVAAPLAACGDKRGEPATATAAAPSSATLGEALKDQDGMGKLAAVVTASGLDGVLDGKGPYTVFAPSDAALDATGGDVRRVRKLSRHAIDHAAPAAIARQEQDEPTRWPGRAV